MGQWDGAHGAHDDHHALSHELRHEVRLLACSDNITATVKQQPLCGVIPRLRIPGTIPGGYPGYPDQPRGGFVTVVMAWHDASPRSKRTAAMSIL